MAQTTSINVLVSWTAPTTGSVVHHYDVEKSVNNGTSWTSQGTTTTVNTTLALPVGITVIVRVRGVDASSRSGAWSTSSDPYTPDAGVPGAPGTPAIIKL
jgi:hypothetical protein